MPINTNISWEFLTRLIDKAETVLLTTHINPDGDGLGCEAAFYHHITMLGKQCRIINISELPHQFDFLNPGGIIEHFDESHADWIQSADLALVFDVGDALRIGEIGDLIFRQLTTVSIDHHPLKDDGKFTHTIIDTTAAATGLMLWNYFHQELGMSVVQKQISDALYTALVTDTGSFRYSNTTVAAHEMAIAMIRSGTQPHRIHQHVYEKRRMPEVRLLGEVIRTIEFSDNGRIAHFRITPDILQQCDAKPADVDGFTDYARSIDGVEVSFMLLVLSDCKIRVNFRSKGLVTVNDVAIRYGGGGHRFAAGATVVGKSLVEIENEIIPLLTDKLNGGIQST